MTLPEFLQYSSAAFAQDGRFALTQTVLWLRKEYRTLAEKSREQEPELAVLRAAQARQEAENARLRQELAELQELQRKKEVINLNRQVNRSRSGLSSPRTVDCPLRLVDCPLRLISAGSAFNSG